MNKTWVVVAVAIIAAVGGLVATKALQFKTLGEMQNIPQPVKVTYAQVKPQTWENVISTVGSLRAVDGIVVAAEEPGKIIEIAFTPGSHVAAGDLLVQQDISIEQAQLRSAEAAAELADSNLQRIQRLLKQNSASQSDVDTARAEARQARALVDEVRARITKKSVRAPFAGKLGVRQVSLGQDLRQGDAVVVLQKLHPIQVNFVMPQRQLPRFSVGQTVRVSLADQPFSLGPVEGKITAINPQVDPVTRNVSLQAEIDNPDERLLPGMYVTVDIVIPASENVIAVPATAILYAPFGDSVFVIEDNPDTTVGGKVVRQQIIKPGLTRGDFVQVVSGLKGDETVVSTGAFKLYNGQSVETDNSLSPAFSENPEPEDS